MTIPRAGNLRFAGVTGAGTLASGGQAHRGAPTTSHLPPSRSPLASIGVHSRLHGLRRVRQPRPASLRDECDPGEGGLRLTIQNGGCQRQKNENVFVFFGPGWQPPGSSAPYLPSNERALSVTAATPSVRWMRWSGVGAEATTTYTATLTRPHLHAHTYTVHLHDQLARRGPSV